MDEQNKTRDNDVRSDASSPETSYDVTSDFKCDVARDATETTMSGSELDVDFQRQSTSSDERGMPNLSPSRRKAVK